MDNANQIENSWGGWTPEQAVREYLSGYHSTPLARDVAANGTLYAILPGDVPTFSLDSETMRYKPVEGVHPAPFYIEFAPAPDSDGGYVARQVDELPSNARTVKILSR